MDKIGEIYYNIVNIVRKIYMVETADITEYNLGAVLDELPNTPAGRKIRKFIERTDKFHDEWCAEKGKVDAYVDKMSSEEKLQKALLGMNRFGFAGMTDEEKIAKIDEIAKGDIVRYKEREGKDISFEEMKERNIDRSARQYLYWQMAALKINSRFNPDFDASLNKGYCTASLMMCLRESDKSGELDAIFNTDTEKLAHPGTLFKHLQTMNGGKYAEHIHRSFDEGTVDVRDIIDKHQMKPGALVCLTMGDRDNPSLDDGHCHLMMYVGKDEKGHCFMAFDNDMKKGHLHNPGVGFVCDFPKMTADIMKDHHYIPQMREATETIQTENSSQTKVTMPIMSRHGGIEM